MTKIADLHKEWQKSSEYQEAYEALAPEFELASAIISARKFEKLPSQGTKKVVSSRRKRKAKGSRVK